MEKVVSTEMETYDQGVNDQTQSPENDAHDGQHPHPCGPCSFVRARREDNPEKDAALSAALDAYMDAERPPLCPRCGGWDGPRLPFCTDGRERWPHHLTCARYSFGDLCSTCVIPPA